MINILKFDYRPKTCCWIHAPGAGQTLLAVSDMDSQSIRIYDGRGEGKPLYELDKLHRAPVHLMAVSLRQLEVVNTETDKISTLQSMIASSLQTSRGLWSTGNP
jgi:peptidylprolyl isomerase domain and WD repeat-containing protein 1